jgi:signal transduction histidine kinase
MHRFVPMDRLVRRGYRRDQGRDHPLPDVITESSAAGWAGVARTPRPAVLAALAVASLAAAATTVLLARTHTPDPVPTVQALLFVWIILTYTTAGLVAWWRRPDSRFGPLMVVAGFAAFLSSLSFSNHQPLFTVGQLFDLVLVPLILHMLLAFPTGRLEGRLERVLVVTTYAVTLGGQLVRMVLGEEPNSLVVTTAAPDAALLALRVHLVLVSALALSGVVVIVVRRLQGHALRRPLALLIYSFAGCLVMIAFLLITALLGKHGFGTIQRFTLFSIGLAPAAFLAGLLDARLSRSAVADLFIALRAHPAPADLRDALAKALRDPSLSLVYWLPEFDLWSDLDGRPVTVPEQSRERAATMIERDGNHIAALLHDPALNEEPELLAAVGAAAGIALENGQLHAELRARLDELHQSRARVIEAGQSERKRLERNLHDGAQQRLVALSVELALLERRVGSDPEVAGRLERAREEIGVSLAELRDVARGLHPAALTKQGLAVSLRSMTGRSPVPVALTVELEGRLPEQVEIACYYVVSECLANVGKHAEASQVSVSVVRSPAGVVVEVVDDGIGGAVMTSGSGLLGLRDRAEALGGRLDVVPATGGGTTVRAELPVG